MKLQLFLSTILLLSSCETEQHEIVGKWRYNKSVKNGQNYPFISPNVNRTLEFKENGTLNYYNDTSVVGVGFYSYSILDDTIKRYQQQHYDNGTIKLDSLSFWFSIDNHELKFMQDSIVSYFERL